MTSEVRLDDSASGENMAHSYIEYHGRRFIARDSTIEAAVLAVVDQAPAKADLPEAIDKMFEDWMEQRKWAFGIGCIDLKLDHWIHCDELRNYLRNLLQSAREWLRGFGAEVPQEVMNALLERHDGPKSRTDRGWYFGNLPTEAVLQVLDEWTTLLDYRPPVQER